MTFSAQSFGVDEGVSSTAAVRLILGESMNTTSFIDLGNSILAEIRKRLGDAIDEHDIAAAAWIPLNMPLASDVGDRHYFRLLDTETTNVVDLADLAIAVSLIARYSSSEYSWCDIGAITRSLVRSLRAAEDLEPSVLAFVEAWPTDDDSALYKALTIAALRCSSALRAVHQAIKLCSEFDDQTGLGAAADPSHRSWSRALAGIEGGHDGLAPSLQNLRRLLSH